jgi:predicted oxidoreductase
MTKKEIIKELRDILKVYHYESEEQHISKDVVTSLENLLGSLLK